MGLHLIIIEHVMPIDENLENNDNTVVAKSSVTVKNHISSIFY